MHRYVVIAIAVPLLLIPWQGFGENESAESPGQDLVRNGSFVEEAGTTGVPSEWQRLGEGKVEWQGNTGTPVLGLQATGPGQTITARQIIDLPSPLPKALEVAARVKTVDVQRGERTWYSGRILVTYLDAQGKEIGETYSLDRLEGSCEWKTVRRQFPVPEGAADVRLDLQLLKPASGSIHFQKVELHALDDQLAQAWRKEADQRIEDHRKAALRIYVEDARGNPLPDAEVAVFMRRHAYPFGTAVQAALLLDNSNDPHANAYRSVVENFFNYATLENDLKAPVVEKNGMTKALAGLRWLKERGIRRRGHVLTWPSLQMSSNAAKAARDDPENLRRVMRRHFQELLDATAPFEVEDWDVVNEPAFHHDLMRILGDGQVAEWFRWAAENAPHARLFLNENNVEFHSGNQDNMENWIRLLQRENAPIGGIGWQGHMWHRTLPSGQNILQDLDRFAPHGLKIQITEYDTHERFSEEDSARFLDEFLTAWFSHPATSGFIMWGFQDDAMWNGNAPLFRRDWSLKPSGKVWMGLVFGKWWTEVSGRTDSEGRFETRGFLGDYEVEVRHAGRGAIRNVNLGAEGADLKIELSNADDTKKSAPRLASSNPYTTGKLPKLLPPKSKIGTAIVRAIGLNEGSGAAALVPPASARSEALILEGNRDPLRRRDIYLRFDLGQLAPATVEKATLKLDLTESPGSANRLNFYVLSPRFVPQAREAGHDWRKDRMSLGYAPGRSADDGEYRLGDAAVLYLGERSYENAAASAQLSFSSPELARVAQASRGKTITVIVSLAGEGQLSVASASLDLQLAK